MSFGERKKLCLNIDTNGMFERMNAKECEGDEPIPASDAEIKALSRSVPPDIREGIEKMNTTLKRDTENGFWRKSGPDRAAKVNGYGPKPDQSWAFQAAPNGSENVWKKILAEGEGPGSNPLRRFWHRSEHLILPPPLIAITDDSRVAWRAAGGQRNHRYHLRYAASPAALRVATMRSSTAGFL